jgi:heme/copper-type cytochrome/quinol oxidase subunit 2
MTRQRKIAILLILAMWRAVGGITAVCPASAADPQERTKATEREFERASKESLDLLRRDAARARPDWMVVATARSSGWDFTVTYVKGKGLAQPSDTNKVSAANTLPLTDLVLPQNASVGLYAASNDELRSFVVPGLNIKAEAIPGRMQLVLIDTGKLGAYPSAFASNCERPCGAQAKDAPFTIHVVDILTFHRWRIAREVASVKPIQP